MKLGTMAIAAAVLISDNPASAALSGYWDSSKVIHAVLGRNVVADELRQQPLSHIRSLGRGLPEEPSKRWVVHGRPKLSADG